MWPFECDISEITAADIQRLVKDEIPECQTLEYKGRFAYSDEDGGEEKKKKKKKKRHDWRNEAIKDIAAFANASGGFIIVGIEKNKDHEDRPGEIEPLHNGVKLKNSLEDVCRRWITPRVAGLTIRAVEMSGDTHVLVIRIPESANRPHQRAREELMDFPRRHDSKTANMNIDEIRQAIIYTRDTETRVAEYLQRRRLEVGYPVQPMLLLYAMPRGMHNEAIDAISDQVQNFVRDAPKPPDDAPRSRPVILSRPTPTLHGMEWKQDSRRLRILHTGYVEFLDWDIAYREETQAERQIPFRDVAALAYWWTGFCHRFSNQILGGMAMLCGLSLIGASDTQAVDIRETSEAARIKPAKHVMRKEGIDVPSLAAASRDDWFALSRRLTDHLSNAYGYLCSGWFEDDGTLLSGGRPDGAPRPTGWPGDEQGQE